MTFESFLFLLLFSAVCGLIGQVIIGYTSGGIMATIGVGFLGAVLGTWLSAMLGLPGLFTISIGAFSFPIIWSFLGAALLMALVATFVRRAYVY